MIARVGSVDERHARRVWWASYLIVVTGGLAIAGLARRNITTPWLGLSLGLILLMLLGWLIRPRATLYAMLAFTAVSDTATVWWFPFAKNLSSRESISFVSDALTISPLEIALATGVAVSCIRRYAHTGTVIRATALQWPLIAFTGFVMMGFVRGYTRHSDLKTMVIEGRALFYILLTFVIVVNECTERRHLRYAVGSIIAGVFVQSLLTVEYYSTLDATARETLDALNEHGSSLGHNVVIVTFLALLLLRVKRPALRWALLVAAAPTVYVFFLGQRRAGVASLAVGFLVVAVVQFWRRRRTFWLIMPVLAIVIGGYSAAFWTSTSSLAFPAQAIKGIVSPESASQEDANSDLYRLIEAYDINYTVRQEPILGLGFGQAFYRPIALPDISVFAMNAFVPHNNIIWIWLKTGFFGFATMFYMFAKGIMIGAHRLRREPVDADMVALLTCTAFLAMYLVYSYVDVSWDARNTVFLGLAMATCALRLSDDQRDLAASTQRDDAADRASRGRDAPERQLEFSAGS